MKGRTKYAGTLTTLLVLRKASERCSKITEQKMFLVGVKPRLSMKLYKKVVKRPFQALTKNELSIYGCIYWSDQFVGTAIVSEEPTSI